MTLAWTVTEQVAVFPPSLVVTVIFAVPAVIAVTMPSLETVATDVLFEDQETDLFAALSGNTVAIKDLVSPSVIVRDV